MGRQLGKKKTIATSKKKIRLRAFSFVGLLLIDFSQIPHDKLSYGGILRELTRMANLC